MNENTVNLPEVSTEPALSLKSAEIRRRSDSTAAFQTVICLLICGGFFAANIFFPDTAEALFERFSRFSQSTQELFPNPISLAEGLL